MTTRITDGALDRDAFRHEAFLYAAEHEYLRRTTEFIADGLGADEPVLVMVSDDRIFELRSALGGDAARVHFGDMRVIGSNPARIIPAWSDFAAAHEGRTLRGIGEPIWAGRGDAELVEAECHEMLINVAFAHRRGLTILCPYDVEHLDATTIAQARADHPLVGGSHDACTSADYSARDLATMVLTRELGPVPTDARTLDFDIERLRAVREFVHRRSIAYGLDPQRAASYVLAVDEVATNSLLYGGGAGVLRCWDDGALVCEIRDEGRIKDPLVGRVRPAPGEVGGRGLWIANQICDLVQIRSDDSGTTVRMHMRPA